MGEGRREVGIWGRSRAFVSVRGGAGTPAASHSLAPGTGICLRWDVELGETLGSPGPQTRALWAECRQR